MRVYSAVMPSQSVSVAKTLLAITAPAEKTVILLRASISQEDIDAGEQLAGKIQRASAAGTGTSTTPRAFDPGDPASGVTAIRDLTVDPTFIEDPLFPEGFNSLNGFVWVPMPEERIILGGQDIIGLHLLQAPSAPMVMNAILIWGEIG